MHVLDSSKIRTTLALYLKSGRKERYFEITLVQMKLILYMA